jgi:hypothetical protein
MSGPLTVLCVLRSGGIYNAEWVARLKRGVERNLTIPHQFVCLSDVDVPCERIPLMHDWPGWWSKLELFRPTLVWGPTVYLDLDTAITGNIDFLAKIPYDFAMLRNFHRGNMFGSGMMWFKERAPHGVYTKFKANPAGWIKYHTERQGGPYVGDQAFITDALEGIRAIQDAAPKGAIVSYKKHCVAGLPEGASVVCYHGTPKPHEVSDAWMREAWA